MSWASAEYEAKAREWDESGRPDPAADAWAVMVMGCWIGSPGAKQDGVSPVLGDFHKALRTVLDRKNPDWMDSLFGEREYCTNCGHSWLTENCSICTACARTFPPCCSNRREFVTLENGNSECPSCHRGEIVG